VNGLSNYGIDATAARGHIIENLVVMALAAEFQGTNCVVARS
jgi:hypothetical protein